MSAKVKITAVLFLPLLTHTSSISAVNNSVVYSSNAQLCNLFNDSVADWAGEKVDWKLHSSLNKFVDKPPALKPASFYQALSGFLKI